MAREKAAAAKRKAPPPGAVARADLSAVEKLARTAGADPQAVLIGSIPQLRLDLAVVAEPRVCR